LTNTQTKNEECLPEIIAWIREDCNIGHEHCEAEKLFKKIKRGLLQRTKISCNQGKARGGSKGKFETSYLLCLIMNKLIDLGEILWQKWKAKLF